MQHTCQGFRRKQGRIVLTLSPKIELRGRSAFDVISYSAGILSKRFPNSLYLLVRPTFPPTIYSRTSCPLVGVSSVVSYSSKQKTKKKKLSTQTEKKQKNKQTRK